MPLGQDPLSGYLHVSYACKIFNMVNVRTALECCINVGFVAGYAEIGKVHENVGRIPERHWSVAVGASPNLAR